MCGLKKKKKNNTEGPTQYAACLLTLILSGVRAAEKIIPQKPRALGQIILRDCSFSKTGSTSAGAMKNTDLPHYRYILR